MSTDISLTLTRVTCPACTRPVALAAASEPDTFAGRCRCGAALTLVESLGDDGRPVRQVQVVRRAAAG